MLEKLSFPVEKVPLTHARKKTGKSKIVRKDTNEIVSIVSDDYILIPNKDLIESVRDRIVEKTDDFDVNCFTTGRYSRAEFILGGNSFQREVRKNDIVSVVVKVENSYDTTVAVKVSLDAMRLVCSNGLTVSKSIFSYKTKHIGDVTAESIVQSASESISKIDVGFFEVVEIFQKMVNQEITPETKMRVIDIMQNVPNYVSEAFAKEISSKNPQNMWDLYNCATYVCSHVVRKGKESTYKTNDYINSKFLELV